jgi:8-oxo-dGTP pyrophosphatase MutT (NUDIX family)
MGNICLINTRKVLKSIACQNDWRLKELHKNSRMANTPILKSGGQRSVSYNKKDPITSYGILLFYIDPDDKIWYLLAQRRDTIEYADFLRGRYSFPNLETYFGLMTLEERDRLTKYSFDELWDDLWVNHDNRFYRDVRPKAKAKYESNRQLMLDLLESTDSTTTEPGWGFPKGKKNLNETEIECAFREFKEETKMSLDYLNLLNLPPSTEVFKGTNGRMYSTVYYIAQVDHKIPIQKITTQGLRSETVSEEISNLAWCTQGEALNLLPPWRQRLLVDTETKIMSYISNEVQAS